MIGMVYFSNIIDTGMILAFIAILAQFIWNAHNSYYFENVQMHSTKIVDGADNFLRSSRLQQISREFLRNTCFVHETSGHFSFYKSWFELQSCGIHDTNLDDVCMWSLFQSKETLFFGEGSQKRLFLGLNSSQKRLDPSFLVSFW